MYNYALPTRQDGAENRDKTYSFLGNWIGSLEEQIHALAKVWDLRSNIFSYSLTMSSGITDSTPAATYRTRRGAGHLRF